MLHFLEINSEQEKHNIYKSRINSENFLFHCSVGFTALILECKVCKKKILLRSFEQFRLEINIYSKKCYFKSSLKVLQINPQFVIYAVSAFKFYFKLAKERCVRVCLCVYWRRYNTKTLKISESRIWDSYSSV